MPPDDTSPSQPAINMGYAAFQLSKALRTSESHADPATRERAQFKVEKWAQVMEGMLSGSISVGSRQPMKEVPVWATPEVVTGGFATGRLLAGGPLQPHEEKLLTEIPHAAHTSPREALNRHFLGEAGFDELAERVRTGCYDVTVPEEGALLVVVWLATTGHVDAARGLLDHLVPHFANLRFYPMRKETPLRFGTRIFLESTKSVMTRLDRMEPHRAISAQREAIQVWSPIYREMIGLFLETVTGDLPTIQPDDEGRWVSPTTGKFHVAGGWPCQQYPAGWQFRAERVLQAYGQKRLAHSRCGRPEKADDSFAQLRAYLRRCAADPRLLTGRDVGMIRLILARHITRYGAPESEKASQLMARQNADIAGVSFHLIAKVVRERLAAHSSTGGLDSVDALLEPVGPAEAGQYHIPAGSTVPASVARKVTRCLCDTADVLIEKGIITSGDTLAMVIPQFTSGLAAAALESPEARTLYGAIYRAFRLRRSLLLLNLEKQANIKELPWVAALEPFRRQHVTASEASATALKEVAMLTLRSFPHAILPNKLVREFRALTEAAKLDLPLVEELAADIFMNAFSPKFVAAAKRAATFLKDSLYVRYYEMDLDAIHRLPDGKQEKKNSWFTWGSADTSDVLAMLCASRTKVGKVSSGRNVARNGMVIEQAQILTTHNLAVLFDAFDLRRELREDLRGMAERCFQWICRRQQVEANSWHAKLIMVKNTAYAWRQMIFFLSQLPLEEFGKFLGWATEHLASQSPKFQERFAPAMRGLIAAHKGKSPEAPNEVDGDSRRFLGWTVTRHWLLGDNNATQR